ncbi:MULTISPECIES: magnesium transporter CorA family protein [Gordonia]|jgi:magnesium transporter|uniref:Magnesium transporter CorA family protein n=1 Tax=Gordonia aquimaris TaxID=2984863 RepID=A0A9X3I7U2_9ACTN|nr:MULTISPECIES: magnesium transporter CorA family protein [Gordonia]MAU83829.1 magnesium transporter [Gordonia sp. (in: high G+C Gram-positive bacteria)]MCX2966929.1 magnesium transporter CorA family protein [Gordonia aquimaris]
MGEHVRGQIWRGGEKVDGFELSAISDHIGHPDELIWADLECPSHETMAALADELDLDPFAIEDTTAKAERVKTVAYEHHTFLMVYAVTITSSEGTSPDMAHPAERADEFELHRISMFIKDNTLITVRLSEGFDIDEVVSRWDEMGGKQYGIGALLHGLLDVVVDGHFDAVQRLDDAVESLEGSLFDEKVAARTLQRHTYDLRKDLVLLRRVILPMREVIGSIQRRRFENNAPSELDPHFSDLYDHALRAAEWTESVRDMITTVFETNLSLADARLNSVMKKLTGWAAIIAVPTAITGFYGQNVPFPGFERTLGFVTSTVLIVAIVCALYVTFRRRDWL